ncbi:MAG: LysM peptidoglycan-binding domain-containing protein, partial [Longimicrobiales bacterium]|nr:LysM peptidoglycan-binding domain-containing protein [Longimicrobiales bacterium]
LRYLPLIESGYNPSARSPVGAGGLWQFMPGTARFVGMDVTPLIDERSDPWRSTDMALDYLVDLEERFDGSWYLALAAYNGGWGRVQRILDRHAPGALPSDSLFWALREHFPAETRDYVPKLLAAAWVAENPVLYGFDAPPEVAPGWAEEIRVDDATSLDVVARAAGVEIEEVERFNPHLIRGYTPPDRETTLRVPAGSAARFAEVFPTIPPDERVSFVEHRIRRGETLSHVADRYRVSLSELRAANPRLNPRRIQIGQWVVVPRSPSARLAAGGGVRIAASDEPVSSGGGSAQASADSRASTAESPGSDASAYLPPGFEVGSDTDQVVHRVASGESLWLIARRYWVHVSEVRTWNDLGPRDVIQPGDELVIRGVRRARQAVYRVQPGDTLSEIALRHGVGTDDLRRVNGIARNELLRPGDEVRIPAQ